MASRAQTWYRRSAAVLIALLLVVGGHAPPLAASPIETPGVSPTPSQPDPPEVPADWWAAVQADIAQAEYAVTWQDQTYLADLPAAYQAPNRAQGLRTYFATTGPTIIPREWPEGATEPPWRLDLRLDAWGLAEDMQQVEAPSGLGGAPQTAEAPQTGGGASDDAPSRLGGGDARSPGQPGRIRARAARRAWYRNDPEGLAMGLRLEAAPLVRGTRRRRAAGG